MHGSVALRAEADEILFRIFALAAPALDVVDLEPAQGAASLAAPAISFEDFPVQSAVGVGIQPNPAAFP